VFPGAAGFSLVSTSLRGSIHNHVTHQLPSLSQAPSKKMTAVATVASLAVLPTALGQACPISSFDSFDFSNVALEQCTDLRSPSGCDACFAAVLRPVVSVLDYLPIDESSTCSSSFENISDTLLNRCQNGFARAIQRQLGIRDALRLMGLLRCPAPKLENSPQTTAVATEYYASKGVDLMSLCADA